MYLRRSTHLYCYYRVLKQVFCLSDIPYLRGEDYAEDQHNRYYFTSENHDRMSSIAEELTLSLPATSRLRRRHVFNFENFEERVFVLPFVEKFKEELLVTFKEQEFWQCLSVFDPRKLPATLGELRDYGNEALSRMINHYRKSKSSNKFGEVRLQLPDISEEEVKNESIKPGRVANTSELYRCCLVSKDLINIST